MVKTTILILESKQKLQYIEKSTVGISYNLRNWGYTLEDKHSN